MVGAGPAGSAAALSLARAGVDVVLVDQHAFPRDKVCGDGLIPDAHRALQGLGVLDEVMALAQPVSHLRCVAPRGGYVDVPGTLAVLPRRALDLVLAQAAAAAGARMFAPLRFMEPLRDAAGCVVGARLQGGDEKRDIAARWVVLASGAVPQALIATGACSRRSPSAIALRGYVKNDAMVGRITALEVLWHRRLGGGYGWIFPCRDGLFNIGVGRAQGPLDTHGANLRQVFAAFTDLYAPARELLAGGRMIGELKGAPLRCSLAGAAYSQAGLLVAGEAAGTTYALTGEGIGKALETGILAAEALQAGLQRGLDDAAVRRCYEGALDALRPRFAVYDKANVVNEHPWLVDLLVWSARRHPRRLQRMSGVLEETHLPGNLMTARNLTRLVFGR